MSEISKQRLEEIGKLAKTGNFVPYNEHVPGGVKIENNIPFKDLKQDFKSFSTSPGNIEVGDIFKGVPDSKYDKNIPLDVLTAQEGLAKWRAQSQPWYEQTGAFIGQAALGEIFGGTMMSIGALVEAPEMIYNYLTGEKNDWDNAIFSLGKNISDYSREAMPIYQTGERFGDWGWYMQGLTSSVSAVSMMVPGMAVSKGIGWLSKAMKLAATPSAIASTLLGAGAMRHSENFREAAELYQGFQLTPEEQENLVNKYKPAMEEEMVAAGVTFDPENPQAATQENIAKQEAIRAKYAKLLEEDIESAKQVGTAMAYNANWINYGFDVLQLGAVLRPFKALTRGGTISSKVAAAHDATVTGTKLLPKSWAGRVGQRIWDPAKVGLSEWTEGVEELINEISSIEGERAARIQLGVEKDDESTLTNRVLGYLGKEEVQDAFIWGMLGGVIFKGASRAIGMDAGASINNRKLAEIANRSEHLKAYNSNISAIRNGEKLADMEGNVIADYSKLTPEEKIREEELVIERMGFDKGLRSSQAGTMDIDTQWARDPKTAKTFIDMGMADETNVSERINKFVQQMENAEKLYQKHYMNLFESPITQTAKSILTKQNVALDQQLQQNQSELQSLQTNYNKILASDPFLVQNANNPDVMNSIKLLALQMAEVSLRETKAVNKGSEFITKAIDESLANMSEIKKQYTTAKPVSLGNINIELVKNLAKTQVLTAYNEGINNELIRRADKKNIAKEAAKIDKEVELQREAINKRAQELQEKETLDQEKTLKDLGYTKAQIDRMSTKKRQKIIEQAKVEEQSTTSVESVVESTESTDTKEVDWNNLIAKAVNERELDAIIDQMTEADIEPDFVAINKKREELTPKESTKSTPSSIEAKKADIERRRKEELNTKFNKKQLGFFKDGWSYAVAARQDYFNFNGEYAQQRYNEFKEINAKYDAELAALEQEQITEESDLTTLTATETFEDGNTPPLSDKDIENIEDSIDEEMESIAPQMKRVNAIGIINLVRRHKQTSTGEKFSTTDEVLNPEALLLSSWKYFNPGDEVIVSVDTEYNGEVNTYTDDRQRLTKDGEAVTERRTYGQLKADPDNLPIKVEFKRGDVTIKVGYFPTTYWVGEKNADGSYVNIADEGDIKGNGDAQVEQMQQLRREIAAIEHGTKLSFKVSSSTPGSLFLTSKRVNKVREKNPISTNMPTFLELPIWTNTPGVAPFTVFNKGFMINKDVRFPANMTVVKPENVDEVFPPGTIVMMVPSANAGVFIPRPVKLNRIQTSVAQGIAEVIRGYMTKNAEVAGKVFKTDQSIEGLKALKDYLEQFMYFSPVEDVRKNTSVFAKVGFDMETGTLIVASSIKHAEIQLNRFREKDFSDPKVQEEFDKQITPLVEALTKLHITVRTTMINSQDKFFIPRVTKDGALDFTESTFNEYLTDNLLTDVLEKTTDEGEAVYAVQPVVEIKWDKEDKLDPKPKEPVQQTPDIPVIPTIDLSGLDVSDIVGEGDFAVSTFQPEVKEGVPELFESNPELANEVYEALGFKDKLKTSLGKELEYKDPYVPASRLKDFKQYQVLDEKGDDIGTVVIEYRGKDTVILHPKLNVVGKGYGKDLYKFVSNKFNVSIEEWNEGAISNSSASKKMWASLEKDGDAKRIVDEEQGDNFRLLNYTNQITPQQKQQAQQQYSQYLDTIFPDSKVKDIVYHETSKYSKEKILEQEFNAPIEEQLEFGKDSLIWFSGKKNYYGTKNTVSIPAVLNSISPRIDSHQNFEMVGDASGIRNYYLEAVGSDALITEQYADEDLPPLRDLPEDFVNPIVFAAVIEPEQIHILGSKQDIDSFKEFVDQGDFAIGIGPNPTMSQLKTKLKGNGILNNRGVKKFATNLENYNKKNGTSHQYKAIPIGESASYKIKLTLSNIPVNQWAKEQRDAIKRDDFGLTVGDYAIGVPQASKISELAYSYLVSDGEYTFTAEKQQAITSTITNSVFAKLLEAEEVGEQITVREAFDSAKKQFTNLLKGLNKVNTVATPENFKDIKPQLQSQGWGFIQSHEHLQFLIEEISRVTKDNVFRQFTLQVQDNLRKLDITAREEETSLDAEGNETTLERTWEDGAYLKMFAKDSAVRKVKLALGKIRDTKLNYLGLPAYVPFDTVFDDIMSILSSKPIGNTIEQNSRVLKDIALNNPYKAYLSQVADLLDNPDVTQSLKNNFQSVIMRNNNDFVFLIWNKGDKGWTFKPMDANRNNVVSRIVDSWNENFARSPLVKEVNGEKVLDKQAVKDKGYTIEDVKNLDTLEKKKAFTERLFLDLGLGIDPSALERLFNSLDLVKDFGKGFPGGFGAQFGFTAKNEPNGLISSLVHALNVEQAVEEGDSLFEVNNPFIGKNSERAAKYLAGIAANYSELIFSDSHRNINGDTVNNYAFHTPETLRIKAIHNPEVRARLRTQAITHNSFFLRELDRGKEIKYHLEDGMRQEGRSDSGVGRGKMSSREQRLLAMGLFQQINPQYIGLTHADKSLTPIVSAPKLGLSISSEYVTVVDGIPQISVEALPNRVRTEIQELIIAERNRIREIGDKIRELGEEVAKRELGEQYFEGSQYFYFFPELNSIVRENGVVSLAQLNNLDALVDSAMGTMVDTINDTIKEWYEDGTVYYYKDNKNSKNSGWRTRFNQAYINSAPKYTNLPFESMVAHAAVDMDINYAIFNANMMSVVQGDPAQTFKKSKKEGATAIDHVETTLEEYQKREAKDMAPGALGYWGWSTKVGGNVYKAPNNYGVAYINDVTYGTLMDGYLSTLEAYTGKLDRTDAQELTTVEEHIDVMFSYGKIPDNIYQSVKAKILANRGGMYKLTPEEKRFVFQPMKPVQIVRTWNPTFGIEETHYIKSSSFPLLPELVAGTDLDVIRKAMETSTSNSNRGVQRLAYKTAVKVGHKRLNTLFDSKGVVNKTVEFTDNDIVVLDREGFFIQQEVPYKEGDHRIVTGSQMNKLLFQGLEDNLTFNFQDKEYTTKQLKAIKESVRVELFKMSEREIHNKLGMELVDGVPTFTDLTALRESLIDEAKKRGWGLNDIDALRIVDGAVVIPFAFNNSAPRIESMILSIFNGIVKQKMNGKSLVQGTDVGLRQTREFNKDIDTIGGENGIVLIRDSNGKLLFDKQKGLQYVDISKEGVKLAQVFMPWKYEGELRNFINDKGELDTSKIDPELLKQIGFRIPTQGHSSMLMIQVVGFLPKEMGDLVLVPGEITKQMGSDFDVDKLFNYIYNAVLSDEGNLIRVPNEKVVKVDGEGNVEVDRKELRLWIKQTYNTRYKNGWAIADKVSEYLKDTDTPLTPKEIVEGWTNSGIKFTTVGVDSLEARAMQELGLTPDKVDLPSSRAIARQALENAYIGIHESVLSHPEVIKKSTQPLDRDDLKDTGTAYTTPSKKPIFISRKRQLDDYLMQRAGKEGVGVYSRAVTGAAVIEGFNVRLVTAFDGFNGYSLQKLSGNGTSNFNDNKKLVRTKVDNLITQQSGAVDNAKTPVLDMNNLNMQTFNVAIILSMLEDSKGKALDLRYNSYFLRQEIIKDYVKEMQNISDSLNDEFGEGTRQDQVIDALREKYLSRIDTKVYKRKKKSFKLKDLTDMLMAEDTSTVEYVEGQLEVLERFSELDKIGKEYGDFLTAISTDSKGFGKSFWEVAKRREQLDRVYDFKLIEGLQEVIEIGEHGTIAGYVRQVADNMGQLFPYTNPNITSIIKTIEQQSGKDDYIDVEFRERIWGSLKSFIFTDKELDFSTDRNELFYGENSVAKQVIKAKESWGMNNLFLNKLSPVLAKKKGMPDLVNFTAAIIERTDEINVVRAFTDLLVSSNEEARNLGENLIKYAYAKGGIQEALQFIKYIPTAYLATTNFANRIGISLNQVEQMRFIEQFYQHYPQYSPKYNQDIKLDKEGNLIVNIKESDTLQDKLYLAYRDTKAKEWLLFKRVKLEGNKAFYQRIPLLGGRGKNYTAYNEYNYNAEGVQISTVPTNNPKNIANVVEPTINPAVDTTEDRIVVKNTSVMDNRAIKYSTSKKGVEGFKEVVSKLETPRYKLLGEIFSEATNVLGKFSFKVDSKLSTAKGAPKRGQQIDGAITINPKAIKDYYALEGREVTNSDIESVILHEMGHAVTSELYNAYKSGISHKFLTPKVIQHFQKLETLLKVSESKLSPEDKANVEKVKLFIKDPKRNRNLLGATSTEQQALIDNYYGFTSPKEFISEAISNTKFQRKLNEIQFKEDKTLLDRFLQLLSNLFKEIGEAIGMDVNQQSVLAHTLVEVVALVEDVKGTNKDNFKVIRDYEVSTSKKQYTLEGTNKVVEGYPIVVHDFIKLKLFVFKQNNGTWRVSEETSGRVMPSFEEKTRKDTVDSAIFKLNEYIAKEGRTFILETIQSNPLTKPKSFKDQINDFVVEDLAVSVKSTNLQSSVSEFMQSLNKVEREALRSLMVAKDIIFKCK